MAGQRGYGVVSFPVVQSVTTSYSVSADTTHTVSLPATTVSGELLLVLFTTKSTGTATPSGWTSLWQYTAGGMGSLGFYKTATGSDGSTVEVISGSGGPFSAQVFRISNWNGIENSSRKGSSGTSVPSFNALTPSWGSDKVLWIASVSASDDGATVSSYPASYTDGLSVIAPGGVNASCEIFTARRELEASSETPGAYTLSESETTQAYVVGIRTNNESGGSFNAAWARGSNQIIGMTP